MPANTTEIEKRLWDAADELRANSKLKSSEYSVPVLGLIFLRYADAKFAKAEEDLKAQNPSGRRKISKIDYQARGVMYIPETRPLVRVDAAARRERYRQGDQRGDEGHRGGQRRSQGRPAEVV